MTIIEKQAIELIKNENDLIANLSNLSALINMSYTDINWVGFYLYKDDHLILGPFQGKPACIHLYPGKGVCSTSLIERKTLNVPDVHEFPGHVACDSASNSELVVPIYIDDKPFGVLDIDSPLFNRFTKEDERIMESIVNILIENIKTIK
ncbi:GAF domain-containing protein [Erysipelothrix urinaevulpis]|uniref:GAF domain-containing protein n=1 Tax=Erysipelothrix urinaevulpis TaxID=2683717 RepID=UPI001358BD07|nr:GAF domain-containing protein [Erysipelothrix urinaevulpis]